MTRDIYVHFTRFLKLKKRDSTCAVKLITDLIQTTLNISIWRWQHSICFWLVVKMS